ncbi:hypothetical protein QJS66_03940 [Kocuria rhizophila]|nr:hypothetical protein QJS66_03940 [Kocuria rhizophila]
MRVHVVPRPRPSSSCASCGPGQHVLLQQPGSPATAEDQVELLREVLLDAPASVLRDLLGNQLLGRALGFGPTSSPSATGHQTSPSRTWPPAPWRSPPRTTASRWTRPWGRP